MHTLWHGEGPGAFEMSFGRACLTKHALSAEQK